MMTAFPLDPDELVESWTGVAVDRLDHRLDTRSVGKFLHAIVERTYQAEPSGLYNTANIINSCHEGINRD